MISLAGHFEELTHRQQRSDDTALTLTRRRAACLVPTSRTVAGLWDWDLISFRPVMIFFQPVGYNLHDRRFVFFLLFLVGHDINV